MKTPANPRTPTRKAPPDSGPDWLAEALERVEGQLRSLEIGGLDRLAFTIEETARICGLGRSTIYTAVADGRLRIRKNGRRTMVLRDDVKSFLAALPQVEPK